MSANTGKQLQQSLSVVERARYLQDVAVRVGYQTHPAAPVDVGRFESHVGTRLGGAFVEGVHVIDLQDDDDPVAAVVARGFETEPGEGVGVELLFDHQRTLAGVELCASVAPFEDVETERLLVERDRLLHVRNHQERLL